MARALTIEEESGTCCGFVHPHNGYYAGDFSTPRVSPGHDLIASPRLPARPQVESTRPARCSSRVQ
jgi:hypothetical protein